MKEVRQPIESKPYSPNIMEMDGTFRIVRDHDQDHKPGYTVCLITPWGTRHEISSHGHRQLANQEFHSILNGLESWGLKIRITGPATAEKVIPDGQGIEILSE
jgi:hypothetical protein